HEHDDEGRAVLPRRQHGGMGDDPGEKPRAPARERPVRVHRETPRAHRPRRMSPRLARRAALEAELALSTRRPVRHPQLAARAALDGRGLRRRGFGHQSPRRRIAPVGTMLPLVAIDSRAPGTWFTEMPRICLVASMMRLIPCTYASERLPPLVLFGRRPPT